MQPQTKTNARKKHSNQGYKFKQIDFRNKKPQHRVKQTVYRTILNSIASKATECPCENVNEDSQLLVEI